MDTEASVTITTLPWSSSSFCTALLNRAAFILPADKTQQSAKQQAIFEMHIYVVISSNNRSGFTESTVISEAKGKDGMLAKP